MGVLLLSGGHERAHFALMTATAAAALGRPVTLFATNAGCRLLLREAPLLQDEREEAAGKAGVAGIATLLAAACELGIRLIACEAGLRMEGQEGVPLAEGVEVAGVVSFLAATAGGTVVSL
nr:DsrE family protein [Roseococcus sp. MDT2-1-1]